MVVSCPQGGGNYSPPAAVPPKESQGRYRRAPYYHLPLAPQSELRPLVVGDD